MQHIELQLRNGSLRQVHMAAVRRIEGTAEHTDPADASLPHTQSRRGRKSLYSAASGVPASGTFW